MPFLDRFKRSTPVHTPLPFVILHWVLLAVVYGFLVAKAFLQFSHPADYLAYYLPQALMDVHMTTYQYGQWAVDMSQGFPGLPILIQGILIRLTHMVSAGNAVNAVGFGVAILCIGILYGRSFPLRWFLTFCLTFPLFFYHLTIGFIDLFAASMLLLGFAGIHGLATKRRPLLSAIIMIAGLSLAMLSKMTAWPPAVIFGCYGLYLVAQNVELKLWSWKTGTLLSVTLVIGVAFFPIRNTVLFHNPTYPVQLKVIQRTLPTVSILSSHENPQIPLAVSQSPYTAQFLYSLFEINRWNPKLPFSWTSFENHGRWFEQDPAGGLFIVSVIVTVLCLGIGLLLKLIEKQSAILFLVTVGIVSCLPQYVVMRYSLFVPLIAVFLVCTALPRLIFPVRLGESLAFLACAFYVALNLGTGFWVIDLSAPQTFAPNVARKFWNDYRNDAGYTGYLIVNGSYPSTIYWAGPDFNTYKITENLQDRYQETLIKADK